MPVYQHIRFIGGSKHNTFVRVEPSVDVVSTDTSDSFSDSGSGSGSGSSTRTFHPGDRVRCVVSYFPGEWITEGRVYEVVRIDGQWVRVVGDDGREGGFHHDHFKPAEDAPRGERYTRRRLVLDDDLSHYEETCFVLEGMSDLEAAEELRKLVSNRKAKLRLPNAIVTRPLPHRESSLIERLGWDDETRTLDVTLRPTGDTYRYTGVSYADMGSLLTHGSLGLAYNAYIKYRYPGRKLF